MLDPALMGVLDSIAVRVADAGNIGDQVPRGVSLLDRWMNDDYAGVLLWVEREFDVWGTGHDVLHHIILARSVDGTWIPRGRGAMESERPEKIRAGLGPGMHKLGGGSCDPVRLSVVVATPEVAAIRLVSERDETHRSVGVDGLCLLGITHHDPITYAVAIDDRGEEISGSRLLI